MKQNSIIAKLQTILGITKNEIFFVAIILAGLLIGSVVKNFSNDEVSIDRESDEIYALLDSLANAQKTSFIGTDIEGNSYTDLALADTVIKKETNYPSKPKKELPTNSKIDINKASRVELMKLPGIGEATANKVIEYRNKTPFKSIEDIMKVKGIGIKKFEKMKEFIEVK